MIAIAISKYWLTITNPIANKMILIIIKPREIKIGSFMTNGTNLIFSFKTKNPIGKDIKNCVNTNNDTKEKLNSILKHDIGHSIIMF